MKKKIVKKIGKEYYAACFEIPHEGHNYFSATYMRLKKGKNQNYSDNADTAYVNGILYYFNGGGCNPEILYKYFPEYADIIKMHLSDSVGVPIHCIANGFHYYSCMDHFILDSHLRLSRQQTISLCNILDNITEANLRMHNFTEFCVSQFGRYAEEAKKAIELFNAIEVRNN